MQKEWQLQTLGGMIGALLGAFLGLLPGIQDALEPTHYAQVHGSTAVIVMFVPFAFVGLLVGAFVGVWAGSRLWSSKHPTVPAPLPEAVPDETVWPPAPNGS